ncbi:MAG: cyanophycin synthetase, partial [Lachnospiraceae bacterium]|nr:cyanophycin synthetase [Lachnospiraceae bacterium]
VFCQREIYRIGEEIISKEDYGNIMEPVQKACEKLVEAGKPHPTSFEVETAAAFLCFYQKRCDMVLLEVGMGGIEDATNIIEKPLCSVITAVGMDHMQFLGNTLTEIAKAKAGIIKKGCSVVALAQEKEVERVIEDTAQRKGADLTFAQWKEIKAEFTEEGMGLYHPRYGNLMTQLRGSYQKQNLVLALEVLDVLARKGYGTELEKVRTGVERACWEGRFERILKEPEVIIDGAHNPAAAEQLFSSIQNYFTNRKIIYIIGVLADKEHGKMLERLLPLAQTAYLVTPDNPRALRAEKLAEEAEVYREQIHVEESVEDALEKAVEEAKREDGVVIAWGSLSYLGEIRESIGKYR